MPTPPPTVPLAQPIARALQDNTALARLAERLRESNARYATIAPQLPDTLRALVQPGPIDETGWSLLAANAAVAAKLRQVLPRLESALDAAGWAAIPIRIKVRSGT